MALIDLSFSKQYGLNSVPVMAQTANVYLNFGLWGLSLIPAWLVIKEIGVTLGDKKVGRELGSEGFNQNKHAIEGNEETIRRSNDLDPEL